MLSRRAPFWLAGIIAAGAVTAMLTAPQWAPRFRSVFASPSYRRVDSVAGLLLALLFTGAGLWTLYYGVRFGLVERRCLPANRTGRGREVVTGWPAVRSGIAYVIYGLLITAVGGGLLVSLIR